VAADPKSFSCPVVRFDLFELDSKNAQLRRSGVVVDLPPQALRILALLTARPNELVTRKEIKEALWPDETHGDFDSRMNFTVKKLREALGDNAEQPRYVQTVRNAGYRFIAPVRSTHTSLPGNGERAPALIPEPRLELAGAAISTVRQPGFRFGAKAILVMTVAVAASAIAVASFLLKLRGEYSPVKAETTQNRFAVVDGVPQISSVSFILPQASQRILIRGRGFGLHVPYSRTDSPYLAIGDETRDWAAGRMVPHNWDHVMLDVESWTTDEIVISGFSGDYGQNGWELVAGDKLTVRVWNPQTGMGPATFEVWVSKSGP